MPETSELNPIIVFNQFDDTSLLLEEEFDEWSNEDILKMLKTWQNTPEIRQKFADFPMRLWRKIAKKNTQIEEVNSSVFRTILQLDDFQECCRRLVLLSLKTWQGINLMQCLYKLRRDLDEKLEECYDAGERAECSSMIKKISALLSEKELEADEEVPQENSHIPSERLSSIIRHKAFFESYEHRVSKISSKKFEFSPNQKASIVMDEQYCLLRSSAGSGKTEVLIARFFFLVEERKIDPKDILLLVYTKDVCNEINEKIKKRWSDDADFERRWPEASAAQGKKPGPALTFHAMALKIIKEVGIIHPTILTSVKNNKGNIDHDAGVVSVKDTLEKNDKQLLNRIGLLPDEQPADNEDYNEDSDLSGNPNKYVIKGYSNLKSNAEVWITFYYLKNGIHVEYEKVIKDLPEYIPDFSFSQNGQTYVHEHFATLNENNPAEEWRKYAKRTKEKIDKYSKALGNRFFYTVGEDESGRVYRRSEILSNLQKELDLRGIICSPDSYYIEEERKYLEDSSDAYIKKFLEIRELIIEGRKDIGEISTRIGERGGFPKTFWNEVYLPLEECYKDLLRKPDCYYTDYSDSIDWATTILNKAQLERALYKVILVDEYQDITPNRLSLLQALTSQEPKETQLFSVGDDWQSIYSFAGSDVRLFWNFKKHWDGKGVCYDLYETFRFGRPLVQLSSSFVMKDNPFLTQRAITGISTSTKVYYRPIYPGMFKKEDIIIPKTPKERRIYYYDLQIEVIRRILSRESESEKSCSVAILTRNNLKDKEIIDKINGLKTELAWAGDIIAYTIHKSKGQTFDYVFVLSCDEGTIPSSKRDDELKRLIVGGEKEKEREERRLFYVALTRAKKAVYLLYCEKNASRYIEEIKSSGLADYCQI